MTLHSALLSAGSGDVAAFLSINLLTPHTMNITTLTYNPQTLQYEVGFKDFPVLDLRNYRMMIIDELNTIQLAISGEQLSAEQVDCFMRSTTQHLETLANDQSAVLNRKRYDENNDHN